MKIPALPETASMRPLLIIESMVSSGLNDDARSPPTTIPMNREELTYLVISASPIAMTGGTSAQNVA